MNKISKLLFALLAIVLASCETNVIDDSDKILEGRDIPITESTDDYSITYQYKKGVVLLNDKAQGYLQKIEEDSILFFSANTPSDILPNVGDVISSKITDKTPKGLGNVVLSRTNEDGLIKCVTSVTSLDDIFEVLELTSNFSLADLVKDKEGFYDEEGNYYEISIEDIDIADTDGDLTRSFGTRIQTRAKFGSLKIIEIPVKITTPSGLFTDIKLQIGGIVTFDKSKEKRTFENSLEISIGIKGEMGLKGKKEFDKDLTLKVQKLLELVKRCKIIEGSFPIAGGIINLRPFVDFEANLVGGINGKISVGFGARFGYKCGWNEKGRISENTSTKPTLENIFNSFDISGKAEIGPEAVFHLGCGVWTRDLVMMLNVKPSVMIGAELGISGERGDGKWQIQGQSVDLDAVVDVEGEISATIFGKELYKDELKLAKFNLLNLRFPIFPELVNGSLSVTQQSDEPLVFGAQYSCTGGIIAKLLGAMPSLRVEQSGVEVYHIIDAQDIHWGAQSNLNYELTGLKKKVKYKAIPCIIIGNAYYDWQGVDFSAKDDRMDDVVPEDIRDKMDDYIPIYDGVDPPNVEGTYFVDPFVTIYCEDGVYSPGYVIDSYYVHFYNQDMDNNTLDYSGRHATVSSSESGTGVFISGTGDNFTIFFNTIGQSLGINTKTALIISGTKTNTGIKDLYYAFVMVEKGEDPNHYLMDEGVYRVFKDQDGISIPTSWSSVSRRNIIQTNRKSSMMKGIYSK